MKHNFTRLQKLVVMLCIIFFFALPLSLPTEASQEDEWKPVREVYAGSVTFIKEFDGKTYFGSAHGKLFVADSLTGKQTPISPSGIYGMNDLIQENGVFLIATNFGLYSSYDGLKTWTPVKELSGRSVISVIHHRSNLFAATNRGLFKSQDNGSSWKQLKLPGFKEFPAQFIISNGTDLVTTPIANEANVYPFFYSHDDGESWGEAHYLAPQDSPKSITLVKNIFYAVGLNSNDELILSSSPDGKNWSKVGNLELLNTLSTAGRMIYDDQVDKLYLSGSLSLDKSKDNQPNKNQPNNFSTFAILEGQPDGNDWKLFYDPKVEVSTMYTSDNQMIFGLVNSGNVSSLNLDATVKNPKTITTIASIYVHKMITLKNGKVLVSVSGAEDLQDEFKYYDTCDNPNRSFIRYPDGRWKLNLDTSNISPLEDIAENGAQLFTITCDGLVLRSVNEGETLEKVISLPHGDGPGDTITFFNDKIYASTSEGVSEIRNYTSSSPERHLVYNMTRGELFTQQLSGTKNMFSISNKKGVLVSDGKQWAPYQKGLGNVTDVQTMDYFNSTLFGAGLGGVYQIPDGASSWSDLTYNLKSVIGNNRVNSITADGSGLYITVDKFGVVMLSFTDNTWKPLNEGLENNNVKSLIIVGNKMYVGGKNGAIMGRDRP